MKIQQTSYCQSANLLDTAERQTVPKHMKDAQKHLFMTKAVDVAISDEGINALREIERKLRKVHNTISYKGVLQSL